MSAIALSATDLALAARPDPGQRRDLAGLRARARAAPRHRHAAHGGAARARSASCSSSSSPRPRRLWTVGLALVMVAGRRRTRRWPAARRGSPALVGYGLGAGTLLLVGTLATLFAVAGMIGPEPWYAPRYMLPILGMVLGNTLTGVSLVLETIGQTATARAGCHRGADRARRHALRGHARPAAARRCAPA